MLTISVSAAGASKEVLKVLKDGFPFESLTITEAKHLAKELTDKIRTAEGNLRIKTTKRFFDP